VYNKSVVISLQFACMNMGEFGRSRCSVAMATLADLGTKGLNSNTHEIGAKNLGYKRLGYDSLRNLQMAMSWLLGSPE
jgi:hypothetical protein